MNLSEAIALSKRKTAQLVIKDPADPSIYGAPPPSSVGTIYMWTQGHTVPLMLCGRVSDEPAEDQQEECVCGERHKFPKRQKKLLYRLMWDTRWEPTFPIWEGKHPLDALAQVADDGT